MSYRAIPLSLCTSDEFRNLSPEAKGVLMTLLVHCHYTGLGRFHPGVLEILANTTAERLTNILAELQEAGWILTDDTAVFIIDVLAWQKITANNANHRLGVQRLVAEVRSTKLLSAFSARYPEWAARLDEPKCETVPKPSRWDTDGMAEVTSIRSESHRNAIGQAPVEASDQESASEGRVQDNSSQLGSAPITATAYARALAEEIESVQLGGVAHGDSQKVKANTKAAAALLAASIPLSFARTVAAEVARSYRPTAESPRIASTHYVSGAVIDAWNARSGNDERSGSTRRAPSGRPTPQNENDRAVNLNPHVQLVVNEEIQRLNTAQPGSGDAWFTDMKVLAGRNGRWVVPFAFEWLKGRNPAALTGSNNGNGAH